MKNKPSPKIRLLRAFILGFREAMGADGMTYVRSDSPRSVAYDTGRDMFHRLTLRRFDG